MKDHIVVVGGYGHVGQMICRELSELYPGKVYTAGRSFERAERFSRATGGKVRPMALNVREEPGPGLLDRVKLVVMCLDQTHTRFVRACFDQGVHYVDISADYSFLSRVEELNGAAAAGGATAVLSVGLAPGLTNLLARHAADRMDRTDTVDISIMLGLGDQHGDAAIQWTIDNLGAAYTVTQEGRRKEVTGFADGKATFFGAGLGRRKAYRFNFSDQHVLPRTLGLPTVSTRLCFDSAATTGLLAGMGRLGLFRLLKLPPVRKAAVKLFGSLQIGEAMFAVKVDARGKKNHQDAYAECFVRGKNEAVVTAKVAAAIAAAVYKTGYAHGVYHIEQLFEWGDLADALGDLASVQTQMTCS